MAQGFGGHGERLRVALVVGLSLVGVAATSGRASAQEPEQPAAAPEDSAAASEDSEARALFVAGQTAFEAGRYEAALGHFRASFELSNRPQLLYNIGLAADRLRHDQEALTAFEGFLAQVPDSPLREPVEARAEILREAIAQHISPEEVAAAEARAAEQARQDTLAQRDTGGGVVKQWWFWTLVGVVVAGAAVGVVAATSSDRHQAPLVGTDGSVIRALRAQ